MTPAQRDNLLDAHSAAMARIAELEAENRDQESGFGLRWKADMRAIKRWQEATGRTQVWPDHAYLCVWLMESIAGLEAENEDLKGANLPLYSDRIRNLETQRDTWFREHDRLQKALETLVNRLDEVHADPRYQSVWQLFMIHGGDYTEPKYEAELNAAKAALSHCGAQISGQSSPAGERAANLSVFVSDSDNADNGQREGNLHHLTTELIQMAEELSGRIYAALGNVLGSNRQTGTSE